MDLNKMNLELQNRIEEQKKEIDELKESLQMSEKRNSALVIKVQELRKELASIKGKKVKINFNPNKHKGFPDKFKQRQKKIHGMLKNIQKYSLSFQEEEFLRQIQNERKITKKQFDWFNSLENRKPSYV